MTHGLQGLHRNSRLIRRAALQSTSHLRTKSDYHEAKVPMLTVTHGRRVTRTHILAYTILLVPVAIGLAFTSIGGPVYLTVAAGMNAWFLLGAFKIWRRSEAEAEADAYAVERSVFKVSLLYLFAHFGALLIETSLGQFGLGGW